MQCYVGVYGAFPGQKTILTPVDDS